jgi:hypothetical protein
LRLPAALCGARGWQKTVLKTARKVAALHAAEAPMALAAAVIAAVHRIERSILE